jgi:hypothetical protein
VDFRDGDFLFNGTTADSPPPPEGGVGGAEDVEDAEFREV